MNVLFVIFTLFIITACGKHNVFQDPTLLPYTKAFVSEGQSRGHGASLSDVSIKYGSLKPGVIGVCITEYQWDFFKFKKVPFRKTVKVDSTWWKTASSESKEQLMSHELGHCSLDQDHRESYFSLRGSRSMIYKSIMNPSHITPNTYSDYKEYYYDELFNPRVNPVQTFAAYYNETLEPFNFASTLASSSREEDYIASFNENNHQETHGGDCHIKIMAGEEDPTDDIQDN